MVLEIIASIVTEIIKDPIKNYIVEPLKRHIDFAFKCDNNVERLQHEAAVLVNKRDRLKQSVVEAMRKGDEIYDDVTKWLNSVDTAICESEQFIQAKEDAKKKCCFGLCPNLKNRYLLSKKTVKKALAMDKLLDEGQFDLISYRPPPRQKAAPSVYQQEALQSRLSILKEVMDALKDPNLGMVGVYGMGGVGKTTLVNEVHRQAQEDKLFDHVIIVAVSIAPDLRRIQAEIAEVLDLGLREEGIRVRANRLYEKLKKEMKVLIILDDIWKKLPLEQVGIPVGDDCRGCKLLLTSRRKDVLSTEMGTQKDFELNILPEKEALSLFEKSVGHGENPTLRGLATAVANKCAGLPLLLVTVAADLRKKEYHAWNEKLQQLSEFDNEDLYQKVHSVLESSYNNLPTNEVKSFFLLCALFGQSNIKIQYLLRYSMGLGLFKRRGTVEFATNKVYTLIDDLKAENLLLDGDMDGFVKMHDVVRDTALRIASREHAFVGTSGVGPSPRRNDNCTRIALPFCDLQELPEGLEYPQVELLLFHTEDLSSKVPDLFFEGLKKLKVVDFTGIRFMSMPSSLGFLTNLLTLCLHQCQLDDVNVIGGLKQLLVLSFADSYIVELPRQIEQLTQLKLLDLSNCSNLKVIPANVLSKFSLLEELYMSNSFVQWKDKEFNNEGNASLAELEDLSLLRTLELQVLDAKIIPETLFDKHNWWRRYKIFIGDKWSWRENYKTSRTLTIKTNSYLKRGIKVLLKEAEDLYLDKVNGVENVLYDLDSEGFTQLKHLRVQNNRVIQHIINSTLRTQCPAFPILESLSLSNLMSLEKICDGPLAAGSFGKLRFLEVKKCNKLSSFFSFMMASQDDDIHEVVEFNELRSLELSDLPNFRSFCQIMKEPLRVEAEHVKLTTDPTFEESVSGDEHGAQLSLFNKMVSFPNLEDLKLKSIACEKIWQDDLSTRPSNLTSLHLYGCHNLKHIFTISIVKSLLQLKRLHISECNSMEEIILTEAFVGIEEEEMMDNKILFPKLDTLTLYYLPKLIRFLSEYPIEFQSLRELEIRECNAMATFVPRGSIMVNIEGQQDATQSSIEVQSLFNEMVSFSNLEKLQIRDMRNLKSLWHCELTADSFCKLKSLSIYSCPKLLTVFPSDVLGRFQRLEKLIFHRCNLLQEIYQLEGFHVVTTFQLQELNVYELPSLKHIWSKDPPGVFTFPNLLSVYVVNCDIVKNVFPTSIARELLQLERLEVRECGVEEIVAMEGGVEPAIPYFKFPELTSLRLEDLPEMKSFYPATHTSEWPKLEELHVSGCDRVMKFGSKRKQHLIPISEPLFLVEKVCSNLEKMMLETKDLIGGPLPVERFSKLRHIQLRSLRNESRPFIFSLLRRLSYLETIVVRSGFLEELFSYEGFDVEEEEHTSTLVRLKNLQIDSANDLKHIWKQDSHLKQLVEPEHLKTLKIWKCASLINIVSFSYSFKNLETLTVHGCKKLINLVSASTAKTMVQLKKLEICYCGEIIEIVANDENHTEDEIINFSKLKSLTLQYLPSLTSFCSGNHTFNFPSLEEVVSFVCIRLKTFSHGVLSTPKLRGVRMESYAKQFYWEGDLNATMACLAMEQVSNFKVSQFPELWQGGIQGMLLKNVKSLEIDECPFSSKAISNNVVQLFSNLREITVTGCDSVEEVFDLEGLSAVDGHVGLLSQSSELHLINLPMLSNICNSGPHCILNLKNLKLLNICNCSRLRYAFNQPMVFCLVQLEEMKLENCKMMEGLINLEETKNSTSNDQIIFPSLQKISINVCPNMKGLISILPTGQKNSKRDFEGKKEFFFLEVFPNLEELSLDRKSPKMIFQSEFPIEIFPKIKKLEMKKLCVSLFGLLPRLPMLEQLCVVDSSLKVIFPFEGLSGALVESSSLPLIRALKLDRLGALKQICNQDSQIQDQSFQHLQTLEVSSCGNLTNLSTSFASFQNLTTLEVFECNGLINMFGFSLAKSMVQLETLKVESCEALIEIVGGEHDGTTDEIVFAKMKTLEFTSLYTLTSFCSYNYTFKFPSLEEVIIRRCPELRIFCPGVLSISKLDIVELFYPELHWKDDLNAIIQDLYIKMVGFEFLNEIKLSKFPMLKEKWHGQFPFKKFESLERLVVDECEFSNAVPSNLLFYLKMLKKLLVIKCDSLEEVFDSEGLHAYKGATGMMNMLNELQLIDLPRLKDVWIKDPQRILSFESLKFLKVHNCTNLTNIFTLSMALSLVKLQCVEIKGCTRVEEIITKDGEEEAKWDNTIFPSLQSISFKCLPSFSIFYHASNVLIKCPSLKKVGLVDCPRIDLFASMFSKQEHSSLIEGNALFFCGKVAIPSLEDLTLDWNSIKDLWQQKFNPEFLCGLKAIELMNFPSECAIFSSDLLQKFSYLERLVLSDAFFEELIFNEVNVGEEKDNQSCAHLKQLKLSKLPKLKHLVKEDAQIIPIFLNLVSLEVSNCEGLVNLMSSLTARSLTHLKTMKIKECEMIREIVATEADEGNDEICFSQLENLELHDLPCLSSFCSGNFAFIFPSLEEVIIRECPKMKIFAQRLNGNISTPKLCRVNTGEEEYEWEWEGNLNNTVQALFMETNADKN